MKSLFSMISIRGKLLLGYGLAFILTIVGAGVITHYMVRGVIESRIEDELKVSTTAIYTMLGGHGRHHHQKPPPGNSPEKPGYR